MTRRDGGFTLIEVLVALGLLGIAVFVLLESHYGSLSLFTSAEEEAIADIVINQAVAHAESEILSGKQQGSGKLGAHLPDYNYSYSATEANATETPGLFEVTVTVTGPELDRTINYLVYDGAQVDVGN